MKKAIIVLFLLVSAKFASAQVVFAGSQEFDKVKKEGLYTSLNVDNKYVEKGWRLKLAEYGKVIVTKDVYSVTSANIPSIAEAPINFISKVYTKKGRTEVFIALNLRDSLYVTAKHEKYAEAEKILVSFANLMLWEESVRKTEEAYNDVIKKQEKVIRAGEKLVNNIEGNGKDKEKLGRKESDNAADFKKYTEEKDANAREQTQVKEELEKLKAVNPTEKELATAQKKVEKSVKQGEKLANKILDNQKDKEAFPRKYDDLKNELDKLNIDLERNKQDQSKMLDEVAKAKKTLDEIKAKKPM